MYKIPFFGENSFKKKKMLETKSNKEWKTFDGI